MNLFLKRSTRSLVFTPKRYFPDGSDRNDYQSKGFSPFGYNKHGKDWDAKKWPMLSSGKEQSPIALSRNPSSSLEKITFNDDEYQHSYEVNKSQVKENLWTGTAYQVSLNYIKDFMTTHLINVLEKRDEKIINFTTRGLQFHFHNPSEHTIDGQEFDLELHVVHKLMYAQKN